MDAIEGWLEADLTLAQPCLEALESILGLQHLHNLTTQSAVRSSNYSNTVAIAASKQLQRCLVSMARRLASVQLKDMHLVLSFCLHNCDKTSVSEVISVTLEVISVTW
jgi:hypothetical protein